jgi:hypothetical protein
MVLVCQLTSDQNLEETQVKKNVFFPTVTKQTASDERNPTAIRAEENHWYKNSPAKDVEYEF